MIRTLKNLFKQDRERYTVPRRVQDTIPVRRIWKDGIFMTGNKFSKTYQFTDKMCIRDRKSTGHSGNYSTNNQITGRRCV